MPLCYVFISLSLSGSVLVPVVGGSVRSTN